MNLDNRILIIPFSPDLKEAIKVLNLEWLKKYFKVEAQDDLVLSDPQGEIIDKGGMVFYAKYDSKIVGTISLLKIDETTFELSKMAVTDSVQGLGIGHKLMEHCLVFARQKGIKNCFCIQTDYYRLPFICTRNLVFKKFLWRKVFMKEPI